MKRTVVAGQNPAVSADPAWGRILEMIKGLSAEQRLKLADNIHTDAIADVRAQQGDLQTKLAELSGLLGQPNNHQASTEPPPEAGKTTTADKVLAALRRGGNKTVKDLQEEVGTQWVNTAISNLIQSRQIVSNNQRPAAYSLAGR